MDDPKRSHGGAGRGQGRKPLVPGMSTVGVTIKLTPPQKEKLSRLGGGAWVRDKIEQAEDPGQDAPVSQGT